MSTAVNQLTRSIEDLPPLHVVMAVIASTHTIGQRETDTTSDYPEWIEATVAKLMSNLRKRFGDSNIDSILFKSKKRAE